MSPITLSPSLGHFYEPTRKELRPCRPKKISEHYASADEIYISRHFSDNIKLLSPERQLQAPNATKQTAQENIKPFRLLELPAEIRLLIFSNLLSSYTPINIIYYDQNSRDLQYTTFKGSLGRRLGDGRGLFLTSRQISAEALSVLYSNTFHLKLGESCTRLWLINIGPVNRNQLVRLGVKTWPAVGHPNEVHLQREFFHLSYDLSTLKSLRRLEYELEPLEDQATDAMVRAGYHHAAAVRERDRHPVPLEETKFDIESSKISEFHASLLNKYTLMQRSSKRFEPLTKQKDMTWITAWVKQSKPTPSILENPQKQSRLLKLPVDILNRILCYCCPANQVVLYGPLNIGRSYYISTVDGPPEPFRCYGALTVCKVIHAKLRELLYSRSEFRIQECGLSMVDILNPLDFNQIRSLAISVGYPSDERLMRKRVLTTKATLRRLLEPDSRVEYLEIILFDKAVAYLTTLKHHLLLIRKKSLVKVAVTASMLHESTENQDVSWMLDTDPEIIWAWDHANYRWWDLRLIEERASKTVEKKSVRIGKMFKKLLV